MIILYIGILLIVVSLLFGKKMKPIMGFAFVLIIMGLQSNVEGDYDGYMEEFYMSDARTAEDEPLWVFIYKMFQSFGFEFFVFCVALFEVIILTNIAKKFSPYPYKWLSAVLFFFMFGMMLIQMKALRQGLAVEICMLPFVFGIERKKFKLLYCFIPLFMAFLIHNSALVMFPVILLYYLNASLGFLEPKENKQRSGFKLPIIALGTLIFVYYLRTNIFQIYLLQLSVLFDDFRLSSYLENDNETFELSMLIVFADAVFVFFSVWYYQHAKGAMRILSIMTIIAIFADVIFFGVGSLPRMGYYYLVSAMVVYPNIAHLLLVKYGKLVAWTFVCLCVGYAVKTSLPWLIGPDSTGYRFYEFVFM